METVDDGELDCYNNNRTTFYTIEQSKLDHNHDCNHDKVEVEV